MASAGYETAVSREVSQPPYMSALRRVQAWHQKPETCERCRQAPAHVLIGADALCRGCDDPTGAVRRTRDLLARTQALRAEIMQNDVAAGLVGMAVPFGEPALLRAGNWEQFEPGAFADAGAVPLIDGHGGRMLSAARTFALRTGLFFEADTSKAAALLKRGVAVSIEFRPLAASEESYRGGTLRRVRSARLTAIALVREPVRPAYRSTWCWPRSPAAWKRAYGGVRSDLARIARGES